MANRKIEMRDYRTVLLGLRQGESARSLARRGVMGRDKIQTFFATVASRGWLAPGSAMPTDQALAEALGMSRLGREPKSKVQPYAGQVEGWLETGCSAVVIYQQLKKECDFAGSYASVQRFVKHLNDQRDPKTSMPLSFCPGESAQVDFGAGPRLEDGAGILRRAWFFLMVLAWSRHQYAELVWDQTVATWLTCHRHAFEFFGGVPKKVRIDNAKCAITKACIHDVHTQHAYAEYAEGYGFQIDPCPPRRPQIKGRVESGVKYLKGNFLPLREFDSLADANRQLMTWIEEDAGQRIHGSTRAKPSERFQKVERATLQPLPPRPPEPSAWSEAKVHPDGHVQYRKIRYSVPWRLAGKTVQLRATAKLLEVFHDGEMVYAHTIPGPSQRRVTVFKHMTPRARAYDQKSPAWCRRQAQEIGPHCRAVVVGLIEDPLVNRLREALGVVGLEEKYGAGRLEAAAQRAFQHGQPRYEAIKEMLEQGREQTLPEQLELGPAYARGRYLRDPAKLMTS